MENSLQAQVSRLIYDLEGWEDILMSVTEPVPAERLERWKIGLEADLEEALNHIRNHFSKLTSK